ncbi:MAG: SGNH/GDSL hydrolase family protein [Cyanobacteria bacterium P01_A01_bin.83]
MFKSKVKKRRIFTHRRRSRRRFSWLGAIASVALLLLISELLTRIFIDISGQRKQFARTEVENDLWQAYKLNYAPSTPSSSGENEQGLLAKNTIATGYELVPNQKSKYWQINEQGFREETAVPLTKPQDEIRIFLLGGSTAFGYGNASNSATISTQLEKRLQERLQQQLTSPKLYKPDLLPFDKTERQKAIAKPSKIKSGNYRVINAAVPGYASGNELAQVALGILKYQPDLIVILNGYSDLMLPSEQQAVVVAPNINSNDNDSKILAYLGQFADLVQNNSYLAQVVLNQWSNYSTTDSKADFLLDEQTSQMIKHLPENETELLKRVTRYTEHQKQILKLSAAARIPLVVAIQPEITGRNPSQLTNEEGEIATELGRTYIKQVRDDYPLFTKAAFSLAQAYPKNLKAVDLYRLTDKYPSPSFIDAVHLNETANQKVAEQLYYAITTFSKMQVIPKQAAKPQSKPETNQIQN